MNSGPSTDFETQELLEGNFKPDHQPQLRTIRLYVSSEFTDSTHERAHIASSVFPSLHSHCCSLGLQFCGVDLFSVLPSSFRSLLPPCPGNSPAPSDEEWPREKGLIHLLEREGIFLLASEEIKRCQALSAGPNFITLLAQRYGFKPLQSQILQEDFDLLHAAIEESSARNLLDKWYLLDENASPPKYVLQHPKHVNLEEWMDIHDSLSKTVRKAAKVALGKDVSKVQQFIMSAVEEEITQGIFKLKQNPNQCCFWFKKAFTDLLEQRTSDAALETYSDMAPGKRGAEFDPESLKALNHLKEARLPAKYVGLDSTNIFEFLLKWQKGVGLDPADNAAHSDYLQELCSAISTTLKDKISAVAEAMEDSSRDVTCQEVMQHSAYCQKKAASTMDRPDIAERLFGYISGNSQVPLMLFGQTGCGKTHIMASTAFGMKRKFQMKKMILVTRFIGTSPQSCGIRNTLRSICLQLAAVLGEHSDPVPGDFASITARFKLLLSQATQERPIYILLDGVDQLSPEDGASGMSWLPLHLPPNVKIILSTSSDSQYRCYPVLQSLLAKHPGNLVEVPLLSKAECRALLKHQLRLRKRTLTGDQETAVMMVLQCCPLPLYMDLVLVEVQQWQSYLGSRPWERQAPPTTLKEMTRKFFLEMETEFGELFFGSLAGYITVAKYGLTETEIMDALSCNQQVMKAVNEGWKARCLASGSSEETNYPLLSIPALLWSQVYHRLLPVIELNIGAGGCRVIRWSHRYFSEFATSRYLSSDKHIHNICGHLADYFSDKFFTSEEQTLNLVSSPAKHCIVNPQPLLLSPEKGLYNARKLSELPHCLARSGRRQELQELLTEYDWIKGKILTSSCADLVEDFASVLPVIPLQRSEEEKASFYELRLLRDALSLSIGALNVDPTQLPAQLYGRLLAVLVGSDTKRPVLEKLVMAALTDSQSLLTPLQPLQLIPGGPLLVTMTGHRDAVSAVAATSLASDRTGRPGLCLVSSSWDKTLKSWDLETTGVLKTFDGHTDQVLSVALTQDGQYAVSGAADLTVRLWRVSTAECLHVMTGHTAAVNAVVVTTDGAKTVSGSADGTVKVWSTDTASSSCGEIIFTMKNHRSCVLSMALLDDQLLCSGAKNGVILVTDIVSGGVLQTYRGHSGPVTAVAMKWLESEKYLLAGAENGSVSVWRIGSGELVRCLKGRGGGNDSTSAQVNSIAVTGKEKLIASYNNGCLTVWDLHNGAHLYDLAGPQHSAVLGLTLANGDSLLLTGSQDSSLQVWDMLSPPVPETRQHVGVASTCAISPCGMYGVTGGGDSKLKLYDMKKSGVVGEIETGYEGITQVLVLRDSQRILVASQSGAIQMWNGLTRDLLLTFQNRGHAPVSCLAVSSDSSLLMSGNEDASVTFWSVKTGTKLKTFQDHTTTLVGVAFSHDFMISASRDGLVCVREYRTAKILHSSTTHVDDLLCLAASPNSTYFVTGSRSRACHVVDMETGKLRCVFRGHRGAVTCARILSSCKECLTGSEDGSLCIWEVEGGRCVSMLCTDAPVVSCDISWKGDDILYGTRGGWVSSAAYRGRERARELVLGCDSSSDLSSSTDLGSVANTPTAPQETTTKEYEEEADLGASASGKPENKPMADTDSTGKKHGGAEKTSGVGASGPASILPKDIPHLNGLAVPTTSKIEKFHIPLLEPLPPPPKEDKVELAQTDVEGEIKTEQKTEATSSACIIL